jgi:SAM-dependent methyltransferase
MGGVCHLSIVRVHRESIGLDARMNETHETNRHFWDRISDYWRRLREEDKHFLRLTTEPELAFEGGLLEVIRGALPDLKEIDVAVVGSGDNYVAFALAGLGAKVTSIDISQAQLDVARARATELGLEISFHRSDAADLHGLQDESFDLVVSSNGFYVWISDPSAVFASIHRVLRSEGHYAFYDVHPFTRPWDGEGSPLTMKKTYWETGPLYEEDSDNIEFNWTLADLLNPLVRCGLRLVELRESPPVSSRTWQGHSYQEPADDKELMDWQVNTRAGLPMWLTVHAQKP